MYKQTDIYTLNKKKIHPKRQRNQSYSYSIHLPSEKIQKSKRLIV